MATGFVSHFEYKELVPWGSVSNYPPLNEPEGRLKFRNAMCKEILAGRMIGGVGWSSLVVRNFFGGRDFYGNPSGAVLKDGDPSGRIVHDYGYHPKDSYSINFIHSCTSVKYLATQEVVSILNKVT